MELSPLYDLIHHLQFGTHLHIGVVFLGNHGNEKCSLPHTHKIHKGHVCELLKSYPEKMKLCRRCRGYAIKKATRTQTAFGALCVHGIYEYTHPVCIDGTVICIIFIGNILTSEGHNKLLHTLNRKTLPTHTMENGFDYARCSKMGMLIESYIRMLLEKYPVEKKESSSLQRNILNFIAENLTYDISMRDVADFFHYNEVYFGRLFRKEMGMCFTDYLHQERIKIAKELLKGDSSITDVSQKCGFNTITYFNRIFKKYVKKTPTEYRGELKTQLENISPIQ